HHWNFSMLLFIKDIPRYSTRKEIADFIASSRGQLGRFIPFVKSFTLEKCEILRLEDKREKTVEYHGLISVTPDKTCQALLERLNGAQLLGNRVEVRPYIKRSTYKDRRRLHADLELLPAERRRMDRRRPFLTARCFKCRSVKKRA
ncbi:MAG: hypothetical protein QNJ78_04880, partial [Gammaproteobacteria bacterium]|nr:hypothetical protein [Gammaproteobacteria bacterium]